MELILYAAALAGAVVLLVGALDRHREKKKRAQLRSALMAKYDDEMVVDRIMARKRWQDMTKENLIDSWGEPVDIDQRLYKSKVKESFKYNKTGQNRFRNRVYLENDVVVGWDDHSVPE